MKIFQSRWLVGLLGVAALALVFRNVVWPLVHGPAPRKPPKNISAAGAQPAAAPANKPSAIQATPPQTPKAKESDLAAARTNLQPWTGTPQCDPFLMRSEGTRQSVTFPSAMEVLTLNAILRQSGSTLAVIDNRVLSEGEII